ncbi:hypothetical protein K438DRAFT_1764991 [Mycena galopus ATCC 62051]|nr:hypothetical protein K438DRAFT_1764991 [Mycena galopus ATCC 62051]
MASLHMARCPCPVRGLPLEAILQLDEFFSGILRLDTEVPPPLRGILNTVGELYTDDAGSTREPPRCNVQDLAVLRIKSAQDVASYSDEECQLVVDKTSSEWRSALAEMLHIQACRADIELSVRKLCKRRLRNLVGTYGVLPFTFNVSGLKLPLHPVSGGGFSDIYKGEFNKKIVCIKVLRIFTTELQLHKIYKVRFILTGTANWAGYRAMGAMRPLTDLGSVKKCCQKCAIGATGPSDPGSVKFCYPNSAIGATRLSDPGSVKNVAKMPWVPPDFLTQDQ